MKTNFSREQLEWLVNLVDENSEDLDSEPASSVYTELNKALDVLDEVDEASENCEYDLSDNQLQFVADVLAAELEVRWDYSGRGMFGRKCPAVYLKRDEQFSSSSETRMDSMGKGTVIYAVD